MIFSHVLYQLSYPGIAAAAVGNWLGPASEWRCAYGEAARLDPQAIAPVNAQIEKSVGSDLWNAVQDQLKDIRKKS